MKKIRYTLISLIAIFLFFGSANAQCLDFAKTDGFTTLDTLNFIPDGRLNAIPLSEGDNMDVYKPFFRGRKYKVVAVCDKNLPQVNFKVANFQKQVIFDSKQSGKKAYEFVSDKNQNLIISVEIPASASGAPKNGCVAVLVGFKQE
jgi:hypothetical protein